MHESTDDATSSATLRYPVRFTGSGWEYFKIWIVNILLTIITLYVYSAWAKVRTRRYFYGNTLIDGSGFEYHAKPTQIVFGRMLAAVLLLLAAFADVLHPGVSIGATLLLFLMLPWAVWRSQMFNARMSSYRNVRFDFVGGVWPYYLNMVVIPGLILVAVGLAMFLVGDEAVTTWLLAPEDLLELQRDGAEVPILWFQITGAVFIWLGLLYLAWPWLRRRVASFTIDHYRYGRAAFAASFTTGAYYRIYVLTILFALFVGALMMAPLILLGVLDGASDGETAGIVTEDNIAFIILGFYLLAAFVSVIVFAFFRTRMRNYQFSRTTIDTRVQLASSFTTIAYTRLLLTNLLLMVLTLGLFYPWARVRIARYMAANTTLLSEHPLDGYTDAERERVSALGEEIGDAFDMDIGMGI